MPLKGMPETRKFELLHSSHSFSIDSKLSLLYELLVISQPLHHSNPKFTSSKKQEGHSRLYNIIALIFKQMTQKHTILISVISSFIHRPQYFCILCASSGGCLAQCLSPSQANHHSESKLLQALSRQV